MLKVHLQIFSKRPKRMIAELLSPECYFDLVCQHDNKAREAIQLAVSASNGVLVASRNGDMYLDHHTAGGTIKPK